MKIVVGFATVEGVEAVFQGAQPRKLASLVLGASTYKGFEALDKIISLGADANNIHVHLGHCRKTKSDKAKKPYYQYHPMLHSKVYYFENGDGTSCAIIGSHNMTGFALLGLNGEASVLISGPSDAVQMQAVRSHIDNAQKQSVKYDPLLKHAMAWWFREGVYGLASAMLRGHGENEETIVVISTTPQRFPAYEDTVYLEISDKIRRLRELTTEVHFYFFKQLPESPLSALKNLGQAEASLWGKISGIERKQGNIEIAANWQISGSPHPTLIPTPKPFRPSPGPGQQQIRVLTYKKVDQRFRYIFEHGTDKWIPSIQMRSEVQASPDHDSMLRSLRLAPPQDGAWGLVDGLVPADTVSRKEQDAYQHMAPSSGNYVLFSLRREIINEPEHRRPEVSLSPKIRRRKPADGQ